MKHDLAAVKRSLAVALVSVVEKRTIVRLVPHLDLGPFPDWLFTSGKPNRFNPAGVQCVYFSETREAALFEYERLWKGLRGALQPVTTFLRGGQLAAGARSD